MACCGMTGFVSMEPIQHANSKNFVLAIMKILLHYGFYHTIIFDKNSKFYSICCRALDLLHITCQVLSGDKHDPMLVERINQYLKKGLKIMTNKCNSVCISLEAFLLLLYAWNSCLIPGTDISHSLNAVGQEFAIPINYLTNNHWELTYSPTVWNHTHEILQHASLLFVKLLNYLSKNNGPTIEIKSSLIHGNPIPALIHLAT